MLHDQDLISIQEVRAKVEEAVKKVAAVPAIRLFVERAVRMVLELSGIKNITCKTLGTSNKVNNAKCVTDALANLKKPLKKSHPPYTKTSQSWTSAPSKNTRLK